jgi:hypothetical protein
MSIRYFFLYSITIFNFVQAEFNTTILDEYHDELCFWLVDTSNDIDSYFVESNESVSSTTYAELKFSSAIETYRASEHEMRLRLRLNLPKLQKKLRLIIEDEDSDDLSYDGTSLNDNYSIENRNYFLRIEYLKYVRKKFHLTAGPGVRFRKSSLHPYLNFKSKYYLEEQDRYQSLIFDRLRFYINGDTENTVGFDRLHHYTKKLYTLFHNSLTYKSWEENKKIVNGFSFIDHLDQDRKFVTGLSVITQWDDSSVDLDYVQLYSLYRDQLYKDWIYYELNPSLLWREENGYDMSARFMITIGMRFKSH